MNVKVENLENNRVKLEFTVELEKFEEGIDKAYFRNAKHFNIPGFRKGKAPKHIVVKAYGEEVFYEEAFNIIAPDLYEEAIKENNIDAVSNPEIDIVQIEKGKELIFTAIVDLKPEVKLGKYKGIQIKKIEYNVSDEDIERELNQMADKGSRLVSVEDREVKSGDTTIIDFEGFVDEVPFEGGKAENHELIIGSNTFIPGFEEQLIGMKLEEEKDITVTFPEEYYSKDLAGKEAVFKVKLHEIKEKQLPIIDDEFAKDVSEFETLEDLKKSIIERLENDNKNKVKYETEDEILKTVSEKCEVEIPNSMIEKEIDNIIKDLESRLTYQGMDFKKYLSLIGKEEQDFREEYKEQATNSVKTRLILEAIYKDASLEISDEDSESKLKEMSEAYSRDVEELRKNESLLKYLNEKLMFDKAIDFLVENAKIK
jgi:trigger factor